MIPAHEQKVRTVSGSCIYAYEVTTSQSSLLLSGGQQTMTDIQRSAHSSKEPLPHCTESELQRSQMRSNIHIRPLVKSFQMVLMLGSLVWRTL